MPTLIAWNDSTLLRTTNKHNGYISVVKEDVRDVAHKLIPKYAVSGINDISFIYSLPIPSLHLLRTTTLQPVTVSINDLSDQLKPFIDEQQDPALILKNIEDSLYVFYSNQRLNEEEKEVYRAIFEKLGDYNFDSFIDDIIKEIENRPPPVFRQNLHPSAQFGRM